MLGQIVPLFIFAVICSAGIIWLSHDLRSRFQARYLDYYFYFSLAVVGYGLLNWIGPYVTIYASQQVPGTDPTWAIVVFVLFAIPLSLLKVWFFLLVFQELLERPRWRWLTPVYTIASLVVIGGSVYVIDGYFRSRNVAELGQFLDVLGACLIVSSFGITFHFLLVSQKYPASVLEAGSRMFAAIYMAGYAVYVGSVYSSRLVPGFDGVVAAPYLYYLMHFAPLLLLKKVHEAQAKPMLGGDISTLEKLITENNISKREGEIIFELVRGRNNAEIGEVLFISPNTVRNHIYNIYKKLGIKNRFQLLALCQSDEHS